MLHVYSQWSMRLATPLSIPTKHRYRLKTNQLAIYKHEQGVELGSTEKQLQLSGQIVPTTIAEIDFRSISTILAIVLTLLRIAQLFSVAIATIVALTAIVAMIWEPANNKKVALFRFCYFSVECTSYLAV